MQRGLLACAQPHSVHRSLFTEGRVWPGPPGEPGYAVWPCFSLLV